MQQPGPHRRDRTCMRYGKGSWSARPGDTAAMSSSTLCAYADSPELRGRAWPQPQPPSCFGCSFGRGLSARAGAPGHSCGAWNMCAARGLPCGAGADMADGLGRAEGASWGWVAPSAACMRASCDSRAYMSGVY